MIRKSVLLVFLIFGAKAFSQDFDAELVSYKTFIEIKNGKLVHDISYEIKINNRRGEKYTKVLVPYSKMIKVGKLKASIKDRFGNTVKTLKNSDIIVRSYISNISFYEDNFVKEFTLKHNDYPYTLAYSFQFTQKEFFTIAHWNPVIHSSVPTRSAVLTLSVPPQYRIAYRNRHVDEPAVETLADQVKYHWKTSYTEIVRPEEYSPPIANFLPHVEIAPIDFKFEKPGSLADWKSFGNWQLSLLEGLNDLPPIEKYRIDRLIGNIQDDKEKIRTLYHYLQDETRYINVSIETGGLKPYPASYVAKNKYGDCKALTNYFKTMLEYAQIPSYYAKVKAGEQIEDVNRDFPSQQFNHIILYIPLAGEEIWLDCTADDAFNYLGTFTQGRDAFVVDRDKSRLVATPSLAPEQVLETRNIEINYNNGSPSAKFNNTYRGPSYEYVSYIDRNFTGTEKSRIIRERLTGSGFQLTDYEIRKTGRDADAIHMYYEAAAPNLYKRYGADIAIQNIPFSLPAIEKPEERNLPVQIDYPIYKIDTIAYEVPKGVQCKANPAPFRISNKYGTYESPSAKRAANYAS